MKRHDRKRCAKKADAADKDDFAHLPEARITTDFYLLHHRFRRADAFHLQIRIVLLQKRNHKKRANHPAPLIFFLKSENRKRSASILHALRFTI